MVDISHPFHYQQKRMISELAFFFFSFTYMSNCHDIAVVNVAASNMLKQIQNL